MESVIVCPGDRIGRVSEYVSGSGTYIKGGHIYSSLVGSVTERSNPNGTLPLLTVSGRKSVQEQVLEVGNAVMGRVTRITEFQVSVEILCVGDTVLREICQGIIKREDVRSTEIDKVDVSKCFRPGDIVKTRIISLGNARQYFLSTAADDLGVRWAKSQAAGAIMVPISWQTMQCPVSKTKESRKCAKPDE